MFTLESYSSDRRILLDAPAPPTLPALAHREAIYTFEYTAAMIQPNDIGSIRAGDAYAWFLHNDLEIPIKPRVWYVGMAQDFAAAMVPGYGRAFLPGNPELWGRGLWSSTLGLSSGGGLGVVLPTPNLLSKDEDHVLRAARVVRPWDVAYFSDRALTLRPWLDMRHMVDEFVLQVRQGIDVFLNTNPADDERSFDLVARATFYIGYRTSELLGLGLEMWEVYDITSEIPDNRRAAFSISPSVRFSFGKVNPALSLLFPIATPLRGDVSSYAAARLSFGFALDGNASQKIE